MTERGASKKTRLNWVKSWIKLFGFKQHKWNYLHLTYLHLAIWVNGIVMLMDLLSLEFFEGLLFIEIY